jgi:hypothetical protein
LTLKTAETMLFSLYKGAIDKNHNSYHRSMQQQTGTNTLHKQPQPVSNPKNKPNPKINNKNHPQEEVVHSNHTQLQLNKKQTKHHKHLKSNQTKYTTHQSTKAQKT